MNVRSCAPRRLRAVVLVLLLGAGGAVAATFAADQLHLESAWRAEAPVIDGKVADWASPLVSLGQAPVSLGVANDGQFLYLALAASDPAARLMLGAAGFTVWTDPAGKDKKAFGITIPAVIVGLRGMRGRGADERQEGPGGPGGPAIGAITSIEVLGPGKDDKRRFELTYARTIGIDAAVRMAEGVLVYELRVPLIVSESQPYGVRSAPGATIGLGIETNQMPRPEGRGAQGGGINPLIGGPPGGGGGGSGGGPPGGGTGGGMAGGMSGGYRSGMGGPPGGGREGMRELKPIKVWTTVRLAKASG